MSVDQRMRELFDAAAGSEPPEPDRHAGLVAVRRRASRERARRRVLTGAAVAAAAVAATVLLVGPGARGPEQPEPAPPGPSTRTGTATPLDGTWHAGPVGAGEVRALLRREGLDASYDAVRAELPAPPWTYRLRIADGALTLEVVGDDGRRQTYDEEQVSATGDELLLQPWGATGVNRYTWAREGRQVVLTLVSTTEEGAAGGTGEAFQRTLYTVAPWRPAR